MEYQIEDNDFLNEKLTEIMTFCRDHETVYLYGAGTYGKAFFHVLKNHGYHPTGFIITKGKKDFYERCPIYPLEEIRDNLKNETGIIPAFSGANSDLLRDLIGINTDILDVDVTVAGALENKRVFEPIVNELSRNYSSYPVPSKRKWNNILVIRLDVIGDLVMTIPFLRELRRNFPKSCITLVVHEQNYALMKKCPYVSEVFCYRCPIQEGSNVFNLCERREDPMKRAQYFAQGILSSRLYDVVLLPRELLCGRNAMDEFLLAIYCNTHYRLGRMHINNIELRAVYPFLKRCFSFIDVQTKLTHEVQHMLDFLKAINCHIENDKIELWTTKEDDDYAEDLLSEVPSRGNRILVAIGLISKDPTRSWGVSQYMKFIELACKTYGKRVFFALLGGMDAVEDGHRLARHFKENILDLTGRTSLLQASSFLKECDIYVGSNTSLMHFAAASKVPIVEISSVLPSGMNSKILNAFHMGPWGVKHITLSPQKGLDGCREICQASYPHCILQITADEVLHAMENLVPLQTLD